MHTLKYYIEMRKGTSQRSGMDKSHSFDGEWTKLDTAENIPYDSIYVKAWSR